jgi:hypothetical protein
MSRVAAAMVRAANAALVSVRGIVPYIFPW